MVDATQNLDQISEAAGMVKTAAINLMKISEDLRILSSGPEGGIGEFILPSIQEGSTIMPGKVNPVMCEFITQSSLQVFANDQALTTACAMGNLELNQFYPLTAHLVLKNMRMVLDSIIKLDQKLIRELKLNTARIEKNISSAMAILTYLSQFVGHDKAAAAYEEHKKSLKPVRQVLAETGILDGKKYDELMAPDKLNMLGFKKL
jgi:aspartate ammonia-lyase